MSRGASQALGLLLGACLEAGKMQGDEGADSSKGSRPPARARCSEAVAQEEDCGEDELEDARMQRHELTVSQYSLKLMRADQVSFVLESLGVWGKDSFKRLDTTTPLRQAAAKEQRSGVKLRHPAVARTSSKAKLESLVSRSTGLEPNERTPMCTKDRMRDAVHLCRRRLRAALARTCICEYDAGCWSSAHIS